MMKTKIDFVKKMTGDTTLRLFRTVCDRHTHSILEGLPEKEYHIIANSKLNINELHQRLAKLRNFDIVKKVGPKKVIDMVKQKDIIPPSVSRLINDFSSKKKSMDQ